MSKYIVKSNLKNGGKTYTPGETIELDEGVAQSLLNDGVIATPGSEEAANEQPEQTQPQPEGNDQAPADGDQGPETPEQNSSDGSQQGSEQPEQSQDNGSSEGAGDSNDPAANL